MYIVQRQAVQKGRVRCTCYQSVKTNEIITTYPTATLEQLVQAAAIGAWGVGGSIAIAALIYVIVKKLQSALKPNRVKEETEVHAMTLNMTM